MTVPRIDRNIPITPIFKHRKKGKRGVWGGWSDIVKAAGAGGSVLLPDEKSANCVRRAAARLGTHTTLRVQKNGKVRVWILSD